VNNLTLGEAKRKIMIELDENGEVDVLANVVDYNAKLPDIFNTVQRELAMFCKPVEKVIDIVVENGYYTKPNDCYVVKAIYKDNKRVTFNTVANRIITDDGEYKMLYEALPDNINEDTDDDYEFEIDVDCQEAMIHGVCAQICINDEPELYQTYFERYNLAIANINDKLSKSSKLTFLGGVNL
jgi:hypothetical protein